MPKDIRRSFDGGSVLRVTTVEPLLAGEQVFEELYRAHRAEVYGFLVARTGDLSLAEELTADTFVAAWRRLHDVETGPITIEPGWLITVARRRLIDYWRRAERLRVRLAQLSRDLDPRSLHEHADTDVEILTALASLPERQRAVIALRYLDGYAVTEIATLLELTYKSAESLLSRGRAALRSAYKEVQT